MALFGHDGQTRLRGIELRYALTDYLFQHGPTTVADLVDALEYQCFEIEGRASKSVSDALRWEIVHGRARRLRRGRYGSDSMPDATAHRIQQRVLALRAEAAVMAGHDDASFWDSISA